MADLVRAIPEFVEDKVGLSISPLADSEQGI